MLNEAEKAEIRSEFRGAKDPEKQIGISAQLHACRPEEVRAALENTDPPHKPAPEKKGYSAEFKAQAVEEVRAGRTVKSVAGQYGISANTLKSWMVKARTQKKEPVQAEPRTGPAQPKLSGNTAYSIQMLLNSEVNRWMDKLEKELVEGGEAQPGTLGNLRVVLLARDEFYRFMLTGKGVETDDGKRMPEDSIGIL